MRQPSDLQKYERDIVKNAVAYTAFVQVGPHDRRRVDCLTVEAAIEAGRQLAITAKKKALIYAIDDKNHDVMIGVVGFNGQYTPVPI